MIILISDGEHLVDREGEDDPLEVAEELAEQGVIIYTVGVGDPGPGGAPIPIDTPDGRVDLVRDGEVVLTRLDEEGLRKIALAGSGKYVRLDNRSRGDDLANIYAGIANMEERTIEELYQIHYQERYQWFLAAALICLAIEVALPDRKKPKKAGQPVSGQ